jgi:hypothetical protein
MLTRRTRTDGHLRRAEGKMCRYRRT